MHSDFNYFMYKQNTLFLCFMHRQFIVTQCAKWYTYVLNSLSAIHSALSMLGNKDFSELTY